MAAVDLLRGDEVIDARNVDNRMTGQLDGKKFTGIVRRPAPAARRFAPRLVARFRRDTGGVMAILVALLVPMVIGMMGLTVDVGIWYAEKRGLQDTADAAAMAGGAEIANGSDTVTMEAAVLADALRNDYDATTDTIAINNPPTSGPNQVDGSVEVIITRQMPLFFTTAFFNLIGASTQQFSAKARAVVNTAFVEEFCILALDPTASKSVEVSGSGTATLDCGVAVNSSATNALSVGGNAILTTTSVSTVGQIGIVGGGTLASTAPPVSGSEIADPYGDLEVPTISKNRKNNETSCDIGGIGSGGSGGFTATADLDADDGAIAGILVICGTLNFASGTTINLAPGIYIIDQGDFKINANASVTGTDVTIILTSTDGHSKVGQFRVTGGASIQLTAPTEDPTGADGFSGVLFYQDRDANSCSVNCNLFAGGAEMDLQGALYFPSQNLSFRGGSQVGDGCTQLVAKTVTITGDTGVQTHCNSSGTQPIGRLRASLGE